MNMRDDHMIAQLSNQNENATRHDAASTHAQKTSPFEHRR
jgi:hypothetical protein